MVTQGPSQGLGLGHFSWESNGIRVEGLWDSKQAAQNEDSNEQHRGRSVGAGGDREEKPTRRDGGQGCGAAKGRGLTPMVEEISPIWGRGRSTASLFTCLEPEAVGGLWDPMW